MSDCSFSQVSPYSSLKPERDTYIFFDGLRNVLDEGAQVLATIFGGDNDVALRHHETAPAEAEAV